MRLTTLAFGVLLMALAALPSAAQITKEGAGAEAKYTFRKKYPEEGKLSYNLVFKKGEAEVDKGAYSLEYKLMKLDEEFHVLNYSIALTSLAAPFEVSLIADPRGLAEEESKYPDYAESRIYYAVIGDCRVPEEAVAVGARWELDKPGKDPAESFFHFVGIERVGEVEVAVLEMGFQSVDKRTVVVAKIFLRTDDGTVQRALFNRKKQTVSFDADGDKCENTTENDVEVTRK